MYSDKRNQMTGQVLNHDDSVVGRHDQCLMALVEEPRPQRVRRICGVRGTRGCATIHAIARQASNSTKLQSQEKPADGAGCGGIRYRGGRGRYQRSGKPAAIRFALRVRPATGAPENGWGNRPERICREEC